MGLLSLFQRKTPGTGDAQPGDEVQRARSRARQRLIGAVVLVGIGIVGFPLLFETHPRPIPVDIPIEIANKDKAPPLVMPPARPSAASAAETARMPGAPASAAVITESASDGGREVAAPAARAALERADAAPAASAPAARRQEAVAETAKSDAVSKAAASSSRDAAARARAALEAKASTSKDEARVAADGRFVVQVGAFAEASTARETRQRVEKLGLKTYTQDVDTAAGRRIRVRVGPFGSRDEADRVVGKLKSAGLPAALLTL
jgi:DedD protein